MNLKPLLRDLNLEAVVGVDFETYYADDYTLRKMATTDYVMDPRFKVHMASVQWHSDRKPQVLNVREFARFCAQTDWTRTGFLAHHTAFDGLIAAHYFKARPAFYFDTLSMARALLPLSLGHSLKAVCEAFGRQAKQRAAALAEVKGVQQLDGTQYRKLAAYAGDDIKDTWFIFEKMLPFMPLDELHLIDLTIRMYTQPLVRIDATLAKQVAEEEQVRKEQLLAAAQANKADLMSNPKFALQLEALGVDPPLKISPATNEYTYAFSKSDTQFKELLEHPDERVVALVAARLGVKSTLLESRAKRFVARAHLAAQPIYLNYWGAKTGRWSGGDKANWQNLTRASGLRKAILPPKGKLLVVADLAQIEARMLAWLAGERAVLEAFRNGRDVYALNASIIYRRPITKEENPHERFVGKVATLLLGYKGGWRKFANTMRLGAQGPPVNISDADAIDVVESWRAGNPSICNLWYQLENEVHTAFMTGRRIAHGIVEFEGNGAGTGFIKLPNGTLMRYDGLAYDESGVTYGSRYHNGKIVKRTCLHGGVLTENVIQALARIVLAQQLLQIRSTVTASTIASTTHDEVLLVLPKQGLKTNMQRIARIMDTPPAWAPDLPLAVDIHAAERYDK